MGGGRTGVTKRVKNTSQIRKAVTKCERMRSGGTELWCLRLRDERGAPPGQARPTPTRPEPSGGGRGPLQVIMNIITMTIYKNRMRRAPALSRARPSSVPAATSKAASLPCVTVLLCFHHTQILTCGAPCPVSRVCPVAHHRPSTISFDNFVAPIEPASTARAPTFSAALRWR